MLDAGWLLVAPVLLWAAATIYVPVINSGFSTRQAWLISIGILAFMFLSLLIHTLAHIGAAKVIAGQRDFNIFLCPLGDPAHFWAAAPNAGKEALIALAGPLTQAILAGLSYFLWNIQINQVISNIAFFLIFFNLGILALNLVPAFPFDGGRIVRAVIWRFLDLSGFATRLAFGLGFGISAGFIIWGIVLATQGHRFSLETGLATIILGALITAGLIFHNGWKWDHPEPNSHFGLLTGISRTFASVMMLVPLVVVSVCLIPLDEGLEAPGFTASVEPLVQMPTQYRHPATGSLILTSVIPQAPILSGEWFYAHLDKSISLESEEQIVGTGKTVQNVSQENFQMLLDSETIAVIEGLRLAGYPVDMHYDGVIIESILPQSHALGLLKPGDVIIAINGKSVSTPRNP